MNEHDRRWARRQTAVLKRLALKERAIRYLGGGCQICGYNRSPRAMEFHHPDASEKDFTISAKASWEAILPELRKTILLCSNCHREVHDGLHPNLLVLPDDGRGADWDEDIDDVLQMDTLV